MKSTPIVLVTTEFAIMKITPIDKTWEYQKKVFLLNLKNRYFNSLLTGSEFAWNSWNCAFTIEHIYPHNIEKVLFTKDLNI